MEHCDRNVGLYGALNPVEYSRRSIELSGAPTAAYRTGQSIITELSGALSAKNRAERYTISGV
jgi:hypothetical protein